jgi:MFS transporter, DHA1 family, tetracycline resistance protein
MGHFSSLPESKAGVRFIFVTIFLDCLGLALLVPVLPDVLRRFSADPVFVSKLFGAFVGLYAVMQFLMSPILGALSDHFGRKTILLSSLFGAALDYLFMAYAPTLGLLFLGRLISGLTGAGLTVATSYMADISNDTDRSSNFALIGAGWGLGFISGPLLGGLLASWGPTAPFLVAAGLNLLNFIFGVFVLPESLPPDRRRRVAAGQLNPFRSLRRFLRPSSFVSLIWIYFLIFLAVQVHPVNWTLFTQLKFGWSAREVGLSLSFVGLVAAVGQVVLTRWMVPWLGEARSVSVGLAAYAAGFAALSLATEGWMMYAIIAFSSFSTVALPAVQSSVTRQVPSHEQGELQGSLVSLASLASALGPLIFTGLFVAFTRPGRVLYFPGAAYAGASLICLGALRVHRTRSGRR